MGFFDKCTRRFLKRESGVTGRFVLVLHRVIPFFHFLCKDFPTFQSELDYPGLRKVWRDGEALET